ncbi:nuclear cap binding complex subunit CBP110 [Novymonas esmeraldas]|uniref:Nuclear cap binding complex subunit CBP110 n=1 Tax=Novymonas esmeraldas TaxID=1808958 RepID=A0AAW0EVQ0_9TRYP
MALQGDPTKSSSGGEGGDGAVALHTALSGALWHLAFFPSLASSSLHRAASTATADDDALDVALRSLALMEAVGYTSAGHRARQLWGSRPAGSAIAALQQGSSPERRTWTCALSAAVLRYCAAAPPSASHRDRGGSGAGALAVLLAEVQRPSAQEALFAELAREYSEHATDGATQRCRAALFQCGATTPSTAGAAVARQQRQWYEARLYAALASCASASAPGPLARLLVAYAHQGDGRLPAVVTANLRSYCEGATVDGEAAVAVVEKDAASAADLTLARLAGVVAGVLEYALCMARVRTAAAVAELRATASSVTASANNSHASSIEHHAHASQIAAVLLTRVVEECSHYHHTTPSGAGKADLPAAASLSSSSAAAAAVLHAMEELLFTVVLGDGTCRMSNRPDPPTAPKRLGGFGGAEGHGAVAAAPPTTLVTTTRGVLLPEADAIALELFPALVQQLGVEWVWSPLLRHLLSLDKLRTSADAAVDAGAAAEVALRTGASTTRMMRVRWSSHALMDAILLSLSRTTYPQRLLNVLPGSYERLLSNLDLLPPTPPQAGDGADEAAAAAQRTAGPVLFDMPAYYAEPASALVAYFQRAGVSGLRLDETERVLSTATSMHAMVVRLKAQAPPAVDAEDSGDETTDRHDGAALPGRKRARTTSYPLSRERVEHLIARYQGEVLLAAVVVHTQLRVSSHVQQLMRALAPLFLKIHLAWRTHHDGSSAAWLLQSRATTNAVAGTPHFTAEAAVLLDQVGYELYPLEWLPAALSMRTASADSSVDRAALPYSLMAAVGHQFQLQLRGTPLGSSGDVALRHPAGPRASVAIASVANAALLANGDGGDAGEETRRSAAAWRRADRFLVGLMQLCYLDSKTSSTELEGTLAVSSTRRVLTTGGGHSNSGSSGGAGGVGGSSSVSTGIGGVGTTAVAAADVAAHRLRALLHQPGVMDAVWGAAEGTGGASPQRYGQRRERPQRATPASPAETREQLQVMIQLLHDYGAASFDTTVEAADFALVLAQAFLPHSVGVGGPGRKKCDVLLRAGLEWGGTVVRHPATKMRVEMQLQQQQRGAVSFADALAQAYNSATVDMAWLARCTLRYVPQRISEKVRARQTEWHGLTQRFNIWAARLPGSRSTAAAAAAAEVLSFAAGDGGRRVDPLLMEQWTQWERVLERLGLAAHPDDGVAAVSGGTTASTPHHYTADAISCAQWLWYSPYFTAELAQ